MHLSWYFGSGVIYGPSLTGLVSRSQTHFFLLCGGGKKPPPHKRKKWSGYVRLSLTIDNILPLLSMEYIIYAWSHIARPKLTRRTPYRLQYKGLIACSIRALILQAIRRPARQFRSGCVRLIRTHLATDSVIED